MRIDALFVGKRVFKHGLVLEAEIDGRQLAKNATLLAVLMASQASPVMAADAGLTAKVTKAAQPIKDLLIGIADPVCYLVFAWGLLECMLGKGSSGISRMKYAALGYAGLNWLPVLMEILRNARP